jgi:hypothetical protein
MQQFDKTLHSETQSSTRSGGRPPTRCSMMFRSKVVETVIEE